MKRKGGPSDLPVMRNECSMKQEVNGDGGRMRRRQTSLLKGIRGGLLRKWPRCDPQSEPLPLPDSPLKLLDERSHSDWREGQPFMWLQINSNSDPSVCASEFRGFVCQSDSMQVSASF